MAEKYLSLTPYNFCGNDGVNYYDEDGLKPRPGMIISGSLSTIGGAAELIGAGGLSVATAGAGGAAGVFLVLDGLANMTGGISMIAAGFAGDDKKQLQIFNMPKNFPEAGGKLIDDCIGNDSQFFQRAGAQVDAIVSWSFVPMINKNLIKLFSPHNTFGLVSSEGSIIINSSLSKDEEFKKNNINDDNQHKEDR